MDASANFNKYTCYSPVHVEYMQADLTKIQKFHGALGYNLSRYNIYKLQYLVIVCIKRS